MIEESLFHEALSKPAAERAAFLAAACAGQPKLLASVKELLSVHDASGAILDEPPVTVIANAGQVASSRTINLVQTMSLIGGRYMLLEKIGEGGMGEVWVARQSEPVKRKVALKLIKTGMDSKAVLSRFEQERQTLALMDHPNIAHVLDGGITPTGQPYFVMELVNGLPLTKFCDESRLTTRHRLELFAQICQAVQHAHQKGVVHRDLKPANILVTLIDGMPVPKIIDFGVAKATAGKMTDESLFTQFGAVVGTLDYMAPEQAGYAGEDIDTRADIYSLGVILYELLTGLKPLDSKSLKGEGISEMLRRIKEVDPAKPSTRFSTDNGRQAFADQRQTDPGHLSAMLRGELDSVVMKCLEKNRSRRYDSASLLAQDIKRYLANEPVSARPPTKIYLMHKAWQRNKLAYSAGIAVAASLIVGLGLSLWQAARANRETQRAISTLDELRDAAPAFAEQARSLAAKERYAEAIEKLNYAAKLRSDAPEYLIAKADLLQCQFKFDEAASVYWEALRLKPNDARAKASARLCDELLAAPTEKDGKPTRATLMKLSTAMQEQQRPAGELLPVARLLGQGGKLMKDLWFEKLKDLPLPSETPLKSRLGLRSDGLLTLDLSNAKIPDLSVLDGMPLGELNLSNCERISDFTPLSQFQSLKWLDLENCKIRDLSPLRGLPLTQLNLSGTFVADISPLHGMPLRELSVIYTHISDMSALAGMPLERFYSMGNSATDYSGLRGAPLTVLSIRDGLLANLSFLEGSPVQDLTLYGCAVARGFAVLRGLKHLRNLVLPRNPHELPGEEIAAISTLRAHPTLLHVQSGPGPGQGGLIYFTASQPKEKFWKEWDATMPLYAMLKAKGIKGDPKKLRDGGYSLEINNQPFKDLSLLKGTPVRSLTLKGNGVTDLSPLKGLQLRSLTLFNHPLSDLRPLQGLSLEELSIEWAPLSDISPLAGLPLKDLRLLRCWNLTDVSAVAKIPMLENVVVPLHAAGVELLRNLPNLKTIGYKVADDTAVESMNAADFWKEWDRQTWIKSLKDSGVKLTTLERYRNGTWSLNAQGSTIKSLEPLRGAALSRLSLAGAEISNLSPLRGMPLTSLRLHDCAKLVDLSPLAEMKTLTALTLPPNAKDIAFLRAFPKLTDLSYKEDSKSNPDKTAVDFWKDYDSKSR